MRPRRLVVISDFQSGEYLGGSVVPVSECYQQWISGSRGKSPRGTGRPDHVEVKGGYIERLPLAALHSGLVDCAEIWTHWRGETPPLDREDADSPWLTRRSFRLDGPDAPFASNDMLAHIKAFGPPDILCVWGLGVSEDILLACRDSFKIYNSIDAPALRIPFEVSRHFDLVLTGAEWQSEAVLARHPEMQTAIMPVGPEFASDLTFRPLPLPKVYDVIYVAAAQAYKRHDILFDALEKMPRSIRTLCVFGYGELADDLRHRADTSGLNVDFVGPPGVDFEEVNRLMNQSRIGVVCGIDDGAPAILTEYMLAGIPVLANDALSCGLQYITDLTGATASGDRFHEGISDMLARLDTFTPREIVQANWTWPHTIRRLAPLLQNFDRAAFQRWN
ncbi:glycosyltransferase [Rhizobium sp. VS19-DR104.2]|uniref:glycosyltransferase n=1 Tax=unclassified Rhizobium TaxID=2613769 RepID=UPI001CC81163|nr:MULTISPECIES: glycosyltransferase [unclassified Rhizobium]MBZ5762013.1 glycosyltransferase [Rhizobium sp. VS19-DR96]MBZ5768341.1 glycosyltransferase [Rhizobium sp. VS19-DR129.2]MBZ5775611.1 glycosyltransferase [Rhizobium sp. VS19-DRK62.2]MBZ5786891.1 glycosyltransferase [Rhizobium sp. VS19-DR121]MBZ5804461.1 glycosyltransferase [Rhizobium sp. VS19-DR181]